MSKTVCLYLHAHQPYRVKPYTVFDAGHDRNYFNDKTQNVDTNNQFIIEKVAAKSYLPTNALLLELLEKHPEFRLSLSITGTLIEQLESWAPEVLESFQRIVATGRVEIVAETYHHSLAFFYSRREFEAQVRMHADKIKQVFGVVPRVFRNTELAYNNDLAHWADQAGYKGILAEGWDPILQWRSPNFVYRPDYTDNIRLLLKNYKLSDDLAFRFSNTTWNEHPLTAEKYTHWLNNAGEGPVINLFMDYETFGEHQWEHSGIFDFLGHFPTEWLQHDNNDFATVSESIDRFAPAGTISMPHTVTWADTERDLSAWLSNSLQQSAIKMLYGMQQDVMNSGDLRLIDDWRKLQTSDHVYYMCTKWFNDGDIHAYFSPYDSPYIAYINVMNALRDMQTRLVEKGYNL